MFGRSWKVLSLLLLLAIAQVWAGTITIDYAVNQVSGSTWQYTYLVYNDGSLPGSGPIQLFDIDFPTAIYSNLQLETPPSLEAVWSDQFLQPGGGPLYLYDVCATPAGNPTCPTNGGIAAGNSVYGFSVQFTYSGGGTPGSQAFQVYNPNSPFNLLEIGQTSPEPSTICLGAFVLALAAYRIRRGRTMVPPPDISENRPL